MSRYAKQILFAPLGKEGQERLGRSRVTIVGLGALGSTLASHLVRAGVGRVRLCDRDFVELDNLQRQVLYDEDDVKAGLPKAAAAAAKLARINSEVTLETRICDVNYANAEELTKDVDLLLDGTDNFETRFILNDACVKAGRPWIYGGCVGSYGMVMTVQPGKGPCFACLVGGLPAPGSSPTCDTAGVLNTAVGTVASLQATEALKLLSGHADKLLGGLQTLDVWHNTSQLVRGRSRASSARSASSSTWNRTRPARPPSAGATRCRSRRRRARRWTSPTPSAGCRRWARCAATRTC
jgi:adenylyltransferase/sulfurtransferase